MSRAFLWHDREKQSKEEAKIGNHIYLLFLLTCFLLGAFFVISYMFRTWASIRAIPVTDMRTNTHLILAEGRSKDIFATDQGVYFILKNGETREMQKIIPSWEPAIPVTMGKKNDTLLAVKNDESLFFYVNKKSGFIYNSAEDNVKTIEIQLDDMPVRAGFSKDDLYYESEKGNIYVYDETLENWHLVAQGHSLSVTKNVSSTACYVRDGIVYTLDLKNNEEKEVTEGTLAAISPDGNYIAYTGQDNDISEIFVINSGKAEKKHKITVHSTYDADEYVNIQWDSTNKAVFAVLKSGDVRYYTCSLGDESIENLVGDWLEGWIVGNAEATNVLNDNFSIDCKEDFERLSTNGIAIAAPENFNGNMKKGLYQTITLEGKDENGDFYFSRGRVYSATEARHYQVSDVTEMTTRVRSEITGNLKEQYKNAVLCAEDRSGESQYALMPGEEPDHYRLHVIKDDMPKDFEVVLPDNAVPDIFALADSENIAAIHYTADGEKGLVLLNLKRFKQVDTPFLNNMDKVFWRNSTLIIYSGDDELSVRWVFAPSDGTLTLFAQD